MISFGDPLLAKFNFPSSASTQVTAIINAMAAAMARYCNRHSFAQATYDMIWPLLTTGEIHLPVYPITRLIRISINWDSTLQITGPGPVIIVDTTTTAVNLQQSVSGVMTTVATLTFASYPTLGQMATAISNTSGWAATVNSSYSSYPSTDIVPGQLLQQNGTPLAIWDSASVSQYTGDFDRGIVRIGLPFNWFAYDGSGGGKRGDSPFSPPFFQDRIRCQWVGG